MKRLSAGFGLVEIMLVLILGLLMSLALSQLFVTSKSTYMSQTASASAQEDARFVLGKLVQEVRLAGMFGCLATVEDASNTGDFSAAFHEPVRWDANRQSLTLMTVGVGLQKAGHAWVIHSDCASSATAYTRIKAPSLKPDEQAFPIHRQVYRFSKQQGELSLNNQPLLSNVSRFDVMFGVAATAAESGVARYTAQPEPALIRSVHLTLTLVDPTDLVQEHTFSVVAAIRNRLG